MLKFRTKLSGGITPNPCYRIVLFFLWVGLNKFKNENSNLCRIISDC